MKNISYNLGTGAVRWIKQYIERLPIPKSQKTNKPLHRKGKIWINKKVSELPTLKFEGAPKTSKEGKLWNSSTEKRKLKK